MASSVNCSNGFGSVCSGNGVCLNGTFCECKPGWTSVGDFFPKPGVDCDIHILTIRIMWVPCAIFALCGIAALCYRLKHKPSEFLLLSFLRSPIIRCHICLCVSMVTVLTYSVLKVIDPVKYGVGIDTLGTINWSIAYVSVWLALLSYCRSYLDLVLSQMRMKKSNKDPTVLEKLKYIEPCFVILVAGSGMSCLVYFTDNSAQSLYIAAVSHYIIAAIQLICIALFNHVVIGSLLDEMDQILSKSENIVIATSTGGGGSNKGGGDKFQDRVKVLASKMRLNKQFFNKQAPGQIILPVLFGAIPFLTRKAAYHIPFAWFPIGLIACLVVYSRSVSSSSTSTSNTSKHGINSTIGDITGKNRLPGSVSNTSTTSPLYRGVGKTATSPYSKGKTASKDRLAPFYQSEVQTADQSETEQNDYSTLRQTTPPPDPDSNATTTLNNTTSILPLATPN